MIIFKDIKLENPNSIETFFRFTNIFSDSLKKVLSGRIRVDTIKKIILKGRGFRGGSDKKIWRMWFGREIVVVGLPSQFNNT